MKRTQSFVDRNPKIGLLIIFSSGFFGFFGLYVAGLLDLSLPNPISVPDAASPLCERVN